MEKRVYANIASLKKLLALLILLSTVSLVTLYLRMEKYVPRQQVLQCIEEKLHTDLLAEKGMGCIVPHVDPFDKVLTQFTRKVEKLECQGQDWVYCFRSCKVVPEMLSILDNIQCVYRDLFFVTDKLPVRLGSPRTVHGADAYELIDSDHVEIKCTGQAFGADVKWSGHGTGFRSVKLQLSPPGRENTSNVLILAMDSTSKTGFIRHMKKSYRMILEKVNATILHGYNIVGDGTRGAMYPILLGHNQFELPEVRNYVNSRTIDDFPFIFSYFMDDGYRTAYYEDQPRLGTFQFKVNGWTKQPTHDYLRPFLTAAAMEKYHYNIYLSGNKYCIGDKPVYDLMMKKTKEFMSMPGKKFMLTFLSTPHDDANELQLIDDGVADVLENFMNSDRRRDTFLIVMGDHGPRFSKIRFSYLGKLEERLPFVAIRLPDNLVAKRPEALINLKNNAKVLTCPHDLHSTILDVVDLRHLWNDYQVYGSEFTRALSLLEPISPTRTCSDAGILPFWCTCVAWINITDADPLYYKSVVALIEFINSVAEPVRYLCDTWRLSSVQWVHKAKFRGINNVEFYAAKKMHRADQTKDTINAMITLEPGRAVFDASFTYVRTTNNFEFSKYTITRVDTYGSELQCLSKKQEYLLPFCHCKTK